LSSGETFVPIEAAEREQRCSISISARGVWIDFTPALDKEPHKPTTTDLLAAGAVMGIAAVLTGKGADDVLRALVKFERATKGKVRR
jgi:hypothetical protein